MSRRPPRTIPRSFNDTFREGITLGAATLGAAVLVIARRAGTRAMRGHTVIAFVFNALVIAMTVSLITNLVATYAA